MNKINRVAMLLAALCVGLVGCPSGPDQSAGKDLTGIVSLGAGLSGLPMQVGAAIGVKRSPKRATFVPGEVLVKFTSGVRSQSKLEQLGLSGATLTQVQALGVTGAGVYKANFAGALLKTRSVENATLELVRQLQVRSDVEWAQPNFIQYLAAVPNDPQYAQQWHYRSINLPNAWEVETGATNPVTVAVVDSGVLSGHPDLQGKLLPGYDFYSDQQTSLDGDARDGNPEQPATPGVQTDYHGSHVAGTIAAATNNALGVAGVAWGAKILPVRALGLIGGLQSDITDGMLWAAGISVPSVPANANPAQVINLSLGGYGACSQSPIYQDAIDQINAKGVVIVVAAGNDNADARDTSPASCKGVITVGATNLAGDRAPYSNYGSRIDLMAPGGDTSKGLDGGVLSLGKNDATKEFNYIFEQGTSMSAPHVAGVIALLKSRDPSLTAARALDVLKRSAVPLTATACTGTGTAKLPADCGAGLIAWQDVNGNQKVDNGDLIGVYTQNNALAIVRPPKASLNLSVTVLSTAPPSAQPPEAKLMGDWLALAKP